MVTLTLSRVPAGAQDYQVIAAMRVAGDGTYHVDDPEAALPLRLPVMVTEGTSHLEASAGIPPEVTVDEDAELWVRNLKNLLRTGYLVPAVHEDDVAAPKVGDPATVTKSE